MFLISRDVFFLLPFLLVSRCSRVLLKMHSREFSLRTRKQGEKALGKNTLGCENAA